MSFFPLSTGWPAGLYLGLYVLTLAVHAAFVGYVLAGAGYAAVAGLRGARDPDVIASIARDWLPFMLGAAITAGVAPLLFIQVLYQPRFYTANLLLFHRWMAIVPVLIVSFYGLYVQKSERFGPRARTAAIVVATAGFVFTAWSWTENHLLSLDDGVWSDFYAAGRMVYGNAALAPRLAMWLLAAPAIFAAGAAWQVRQARPAGAGRAPALRRLATLGLVGVVGSSGCAAWLWTSLPASAHAAVTAPAMLPWLIALAAGRAAELIGWSLVVRAPDSRRALIAATAAAALSLLAGVAVRESVRLGLLETVRPRVAAAGGLAVFLISLAAGVAALVWIGKRVARELAPR